MPDETYSKMELDQRFKSLEEKNDAWSADILRAIEKSHTEQMKRYDDLDTKIDPVLKLYNGGGVLGTLLINAGKLVLAIGAIGAFGLYIVNWIRHG